MEARLTALLVGELSAEEAATVRDAIAQDARLARLHERLKQTIIVENKPGANGNLAASPTPSRPFSDLPVRPPAR
jgi:anti-sigma factor RsiW